MSRLRRGSSLAAGLLSLGVLALAGCGSSQPPAKPLSQLPAGQILAKALAAARSAGSMYYTEYGGETVSSSTASIMATGDALLTSGYQDTKDINGAEMAEIVTPSGTYLRGNAAAWTDFIGTPAATATRLADRWVILKAGDPKYQLTTEGVTGNSLLSVFTPEGKLTKSKKLAKVSGHSAVVVYGAASAATGMGAGAEAGLYVSATGDPLPLAAVVIGTDGSENEVIFTLMSWGKKVANAATPADAVPYPAG